MPGLDGRVAVITGASSGIGEHVARALAEQGAHVALLARRADRLEAIAEQLARSGRRARVYKVDVTDAAALEAIAETVGKDLGPVSIVVNNAGIMSPTPIAQKDPSPWQRQVDLNITGLNNVILAFVDRLLTTAASSGVADLVNTASIAGKLPFTRLA